MVTKEDFSRFASQFGIRDVDNISLDIDFSKLVAGVGTINAGVDFPFRVLKIVTAPQGPKDFTDGLIGTILPYPHDTLGDERHEEYLDSMGEEDLFHNTESNFSIDVESLGNSILIACLYYFRIGDFETLGKIMRGYKDAMPYMQIAPSKWRFAQKTTSNHPLAIIGKITSDEQIKDPYSHQEIIFPSR